MNTSKKLLILEEDKVVRIVFEKYGDIKPFLVEKVNFDSLYVRLKEITVKDIDEGKFDFSKHDVCYIDGVQ